MSTIINRALNQALRRMDDRELEYQVGDPFVSEGLNYWPPWTDPLPTAMASYAYDGAGQVGGVMSLQPMWDDRIRYGGWSNFPYRITGIAQDESGNPLSNTVLSLFRASDEAWMYDAVSKDGGQYDFGVSDTVTTYYIVAFNAGVGKQGVSVQTLTGS
jgi:hypothetical protein